MYPAYIYNYQVEPLRYKGYKFYEFVKSLMDQRVAAKKKSKQYPKGSVEADKWELESDSLKITINSILNLI